MHVSCKYLSSSWHLAILHVTVFIIFGMIFACSCDYHLHTYIYLFLLKTCGCWDVQILHVTDFFLYWQYVMHIYCLIGLCGSFRRVALPPALRAHVIRNILDYDQEQIMYVKRKSLPKSGLGPPVPQAHVIWWGFSFHHNIYHIFVLDLSPVKCGSCPLFHRHSW